MTDEKKEKRKEFLKNYYRAGKLNCLTWLEEVRKLSMFDF